MPIARGITCTINAAVAANPCLMLPCMNKQQRLALRLWAMAQIIESLGGDAQESLDDATQVPPSAINEEFLDASLTSLYLNLAAQYYGVTVPTDPSELAALVHCYECSPNMVVAELALLCRMLSLMYTAGSSPQ